VTRTVLRLAVLVVVAASLSGCAAAISYRKGFDAGKRNDWDAAVAHYREAVQDDPDRPEYRIALERAMLEAAVIHAAAGKDFEEKGQLDASTSAPANTTRPTGSLPRRRRSSIARSLMPSRRAGPVRKSTRCVNGRGG